MPRTILSTPLLTGAGRPNAAREFANSSWARISSDSGARTMSVSRKPK